MSTANPIEIATARLVLASASRISAQAAMSPARSRRSSSISAEMPAAETSSHGTWKPHIVCCQPGPRNNIDAASSSASRPPTRVRAYTNTSAATPTLRQITSVR